MNFTNKHVKIFKRIHNKHNVSLDFLTLNFGKVVKYFKYATTNHLILKKKLIMKDNRALVQYNWLRKNLFSAKSKKKKTLPWAKRVVLYLKKKRALQKIQEDEDTIVDSGVCPNETDMSPDEVQKKLKEQLELLKSGRRSVSLLGDSSKKSLIKVSPYESSGCSTPTSSKDLNFSVNSSKSINIESSSSNLLGTSARDDSIFDQPSTSKAALAAINNIDETAENSDDSQARYTEKGNITPRNGLKFIDLLINKMQTVTQNNSKKEDDTCLESTPSNDQLSENLETLVQDVPSENIVCTPQIEPFETVTINERTNISQENCEKLEHNAEVLVPKNLQDSNGLEESEPRPHSSGEECSSSSSEFLGFSEFDVAPSIVPGMLPTPIVNPTIDSSKSAFISEDLENFLRENSLENSAQIELPKRKSFEDGLVYDGATPPKMIMPVVPEELMKPRTVAEKRSILQRRQSVKYYMIENENTIYRELKKRTKIGKANISLVKYIQNLSVPFTRDCWKAAAWLRTENGKFYFQILNVDGEEVKLLGGKGNHARKYMPHQVSKPPPNALRSYCPPKCRQNMAFKNIKINMSDDESSDEIEEKPTLPDLKMQIGPVENEKPLFKPGPLSKKYLLNPIEPNLGDLEIYEMPDLQVEVFPEVDKPLDEYIKPYLKMILPSERITREWAEFAVSTLVTKSKEVNPRKSFTFTIPYLNNQRKLLIRKMYRRKETFEKFAEEEELSFRKDIDPEDTVSVDCANVLSEMITSVAMGLSEDSFIKDDPDIDYLHNNEQNALVIQQDINEGKRKQTARKRTVRDKLVTELKKLNATVVDAESLFAQEEKKCRNAYCRLGCVCNSLTGPPSLPKHCRKASCMLECNCKSGNGTDINNLPNSTLTTEDAIRIRKKATEKLAKVEKEFCATLVLTDKETFLINEPNAERKRSKKLPKRFVDYDTNGDIEKKEPVDEDSQSIPTLYPYDEEPPPKKFKHCTVDLGKLIGLDGIQPWCMIHCLYKCFCKGETVTGEPFQIKKEETIIKEEIVYARKPTYSFDREIITNTGNKLLFNQGFNKHYNEQRIINIQPNNFKERNLSSKNKYLNSPFRNETIAKLRYYNIGSHLCKRVCAIPAEAYKNINRKRAKKIRQSIRQNENDKTRYLLVQKINNSLTYENNLDTSQYSSPPVENVDNTNQSSMRMKYNKYNQNEGVDSYMSESSDNNCSIKDAPPLKYPVIASVCSLNQSAELKSKSELSPPSVRESNLQENFSVNNVVGNFMSQKLSKEFHQNTVKKLNLAVTRTMHSICAIQRRNTKQIPPPVPNTLSSHQWKLFLQAYVEGLVYVWEVRLLGGTFIAATTRNIMPIVPNALSVINIKAIPKDNLPLLGKMLNARFINHKTKTLSVLMTGDRNFWRIIGFINSTYDYLNQGGIFKPTPQSHPWLSKKINMLYESLILRQIKDGINSYQITRLGSQIPDQKSHEASKDLNSRVSDYADNQIGIPSMQVPPSNLQIKQVTHAEIEGIVIPIDVTGDHRWLVLDLVDDFSHIYIPAWKNFLSHDRIKKAIILSYTTKKIVRIGRGISSVDVFATPDDRARIYIGPLSMFKNHDIVLYQKIDGRMMLREDFERSHNIIKETHTSGFWLYKKNGKLIFDMNLSGYSITGVITPKEEKDKEERKIIKRKENENPPKASTIQEKSVATQPVLGNTSELESKKDLDPLGQEKSVTTTNPEGKSNTSKSIKIISNVPVVPAVNNVMNNRTTPMKIIASQHREEKTKVITLMPNKVKPSLVQISDQKDQPPPIIINQKLLRNTQNKEISSQSTDTLSTMKKKENVEESQTSVQSNAPGTVNTAQLNKVKPSTSTAIIKPTTSSTSSLSSMKVAKITAVKSGANIYVINKNEPPKQNEVLSQELRKDMPSNLPKDLVIMPESQTKQNDTTNSAKTKETSEKILRIKDFKPANLGKFSFLGTLRAKADSEKPVETKASKPVTTTKLLTIQNARPITTIATTQSNATTTSSPIVIKQTNQSPPKLLIVPSANRTNQAKSIPPPLSQYKQLKRNESSGSKLPVETITLFPIASNSNKTVINRVEKSDQNCGDYRTKAEYGYLVCVDVPEIGKFPTKKIGDIYLIKMPTLKGILKIHGIRMVNQHLTQFLKNSPLAKPNMRWKFIYNGARLMKVKSKNVKEPKEELQEKPSSVQKSPVKSYKIQSITVQSQPSTSNFTMGKQLKSLGVDSELKQLKDFTITKTNVKKPTASLAKKRISKEADNADKSNSSKDSRIVSMQTSSPEVILIDDDD